MTCPSCGHEQREPRLVISTDCRSCGTHYLVDHGKPVVKSAAPAWFHLPPTAHDEAEPAAATEQSATDSGPAVEPVAVRRSINPFSRLFAPKPPERREVSCFECGRSHSAIAEASATNCPACGAYISLKHYDIRDAWSRSIETRGDVIVRRSGSVNGVSVRCHHLEVAGEFNATVQCSGDFIIRSTSKILGRVKCHRLRVERRARVEFFSPVHADGVIIDGEVTGDLICPGRLVLEKRALLTGDITVGSILMKEGARHHGAVSTHAPVPARD